MSISFCLIKPFTKCCHRTIINFGVVSHYPLLRRGEEETEETRKGEIRKGEKRREEKRTREDKRKKEKKSRVEVRRGEEMR